MKFPLLEMMRSLATDEVAAKVVSKAATLLYGQEIENLLASVKAATARGTPTNHDLERGIRLAQITATLVVVRQYATAEERERVAEGVFTPDAFIAPALDFLRDQAGLSARLSVTRNDDLVAMLESGLNAALVEAGQGLESRETRSHRVVAEKAVWAELLAGVPQVDPSEALRRRFNGEEDDEPGWFACFLAFFREALKIDPKIRVPFFVGRVVEILRQLAALQSALGRLSGEVADGFDRIGTEAERRHREILEAIAREKGVPVAPLLAVLKRLGEADMPVELVIARIEAAADRLLELEARLSQASNDRPESAAARQNAMRLLDIGDLAGAEAALRDARSALRGRRERTAREEAGLLRDEAGIARLRLDYPAEIALRREAAALLDFDVRAAWTAWLELSDSMFRYGDDFGDQAALRAAVLSLEEEALPRALRADRPLDWAKTQNNLGNALQILGERGDDKALAKAVTAYKNALLEFTRKRAALDWAATQNNLGNALQILGERGDNIALAEAGIAYKNALRERTKTRVPLQWAATQNNLGNALQILGERGDDKALAKAVIAYKNSLRERTRTRVPLQWAATQNNLGNALQILGERGDDKALAKAVTAHQNALLEFTKERVPLQWAITQANLALAEMALGDRCEDPRVWLSALSRVSAALEEFLPRSAYMTAKAERLAARLRAKLNQAE